jgi:hypothetical protein
MQAAASTAERPELVEPPTLSRALGDLQIKRIDVTNERTHDERAWSIVAAARQRAFRRAATFGLAACAHPLILAAVMAVSAYKHNTPHLFSTYVHLYASFFVIAATPVALAVAMILTRQLRFLVLTVLALIAALWAWGWTLHGSDPVGLWVMIAGLPTAVVLLLNARRLRAIGPIVFAATLFLFCAIVVGQSYGALYLWNVIGPVHFIREDLAQLPLSAAVVAKVTPLSGSGNTCPFSVRNATACDDLIAKAHEMMYCSRIAAGKIDHPYACESARCVGGLRVHVSRKISNVTRWSGTSSIKVRSSKTQPFLSDVKPRKSMATRSLCAISLVTVLPRIVAAKEFVDAVAPIRIGPKAQSCKAPIEIGAGVDVGACQTPADKIKELVGLETSAGPLALSSGLRVIEPVREAI